MDAVDGEVIEEAEETMELQQQQQLTNYLYEALQ
jgi:hypothetical protein